MTYLLRRSAFSVACVLASAQVASAEISADDVWANFQAYVGALGGTLSGDVARSGNTTTVSGLQASFNLPFALGSINITQNEVGLREAGDGTVEIIYPAEISYGFVADIADEGVFSGTVLMGHTNLVAKASGAPGQIDYTYSADALTGKLGEIGMPEMEDVGRLEATVDLVLRDMSGTSSIKEGTLLQTADTFQMGEHTFEMTWTMDDGSSVASGTSSTKAQSASFTSVFAIPTENVDLMNLAAAIQAGLMLKAETATTGYQSSQTTVLDGQPVTQQSSGQDAANTRISLDPSGVKISGEGTGFFADFLIPEVLPFPVRLDGQAVSARLEVPLTGGEAPQPYALGMSLDGLTLSDQVWGLFDPTGVLPRDPARINLDLTGTVRNLVDLLNIPALMVAGDSGMPVEPVSADLNDLTVEAAGVAANATGALTFDNSDKTSYDGLPKPVGEVGITLKGANGLMESLVAMGMMSEQDVAGARMGMAMVARPEGDPADDMLVSQFVFGEDGSIKANGMQLK